MTTSSPSSPSLLISTVRFTSPPPDDGNQEEEAPPPQPPSRENTRMSRGRIRHHDNGDDAYDDNTGSRELELSEDFVVSRSPIMYRLMHHLFSNTIYYWWCILSFIASGIIYNWIEYQQYLLDMNDNNNGSSSSNSNIIDLLVTLIIFWVIFFMVLGIQIIIFGFLTNHCGGCCNKTKSSATRTSYHEHLIRLGMNSSTYLLPKSVIWRMSLVSNLVVTVVMAAGILALSGGFSWCHRIDDSLRDVCWANVSLYVVIIFHCIILSMGCFTSMKLASILVSRRIDAVTYCLETTDPDKQTLKWDEELIPQLQDLVIDILPTLCTAFGSLIDLAFVGCWSIAFLYFYKAIMLIFDDNERVGDGVKPTIVSFLMGIFFLVSPFWLSLDVAGTSCRCGKLIETLSQKRVKYLFKMSSTSQTHNGNQEEAAIAQLQRLIQDQNSGRGIGFMTTVLGMYVDYVFIMRMALQAVGMATFLYGVALAYSDNTQSDYVLEELEALRKALTTCDCNNSDVFLDGEL